MTERACEWCGKSFSPKRRTSRTCTAACRKALNTAETNARTAEARAAARGQTRDCEQCGTAFRPLRQDSRHCSPTCRSKARHIKARHEKRCTVCAGDFVSTRPEAAVCSSCCALRLRELRHPGRRRAQEAARRATIILGHVSASDWKRVLNRARGCCYYCGERAVLTMEHVVPLSRGGAHTIGNVVPACGPCNYSKNARLLSEWRHLRRIRAA